MSSIIDHAWAPDELVRPKICSVNTLTAEELERLQQKDEAASRQANARFEQQVRARTAELAQTNAALQAAMQAHKPGEHEWTQYSCASESCAGSCILIVSDTGVGPPEGLDVRATESLGWQLVCLLTEHRRVYPWWVR